MEKIIRFLSEALQYYTTAPRFKNWGFPKSMTIITAFAPHPCDDLPYCVGVYFEDEVF